MRGFFRDMLAWVRVARSSPKTKSFAVVAVMFMMGRGLEGVGFWSGVGMIIGGTFIASALLFMTYFFPTAGALIR